MARRSALPSPRLRKSEEWLLFTWTSGTRSRLKFGPENFYCWQSWHGTCNVKRGRQGIVESTAVQQNMTWKGPGPALGEPVERLGDCGPLIEQLGSPAGLASLAEDTASLRMASVDDVGSLRCFLIDYRNQILLPVELPAIRRAFEHACRHEVQELLGFDRWIAAEQAVRPFSEASRRVGQTELLKLRPLRDERIVRRYLEAVDRGEAHAWHTLVYGLTLALYSIPLRQGLLGYGFQTTRGFLLPAAKALGLTEDQSRKLLEEACSTLPGCVENLIGSRVEA